MLNNSDFDRYRKNIWDHDRFREKKTATPNWRRGYAMQCRKIYLGLVAQWERDKGTHVAIPHEKLEAKARREAERIVNRAIRTYNQKEIKCQ